MARHPFGFTTRLRGWIMTIALGLALAPAWAAAQNIVIVTDVSGNVSGQEKIAMLSELGANTRLQIDGGGKLVVIYLASGDEYSFTGPAQVLLQTSGPQMLSGAIPQKKTSLLGKNSAVIVKPVHVTQAAVVMRGIRPAARIKLLSPAGTRTLDPSPQFRWEGFEQGLAYHFELTDDTGHAIYAVEIQETNLSLPSSVQLQEGATHTWEISTRTADGRRYVSTSDFAVASAAVRSDAQALRPGANASVSERVAYATWLSRMELREEARKFWKSLAAERPEEPALKAMVDD